MKTIHKYRLSIADHQTIQIPYGSEVVHIGLDTSGTPCVWARVETEEPMAERQFWIVGTGQPQPEFPANTCTDYLGTFVQDQFVWHVYGPKFPKWSLGGF